MAAVVQLYPADALCIDQGRLRALRAEFGSRGAADLLARAADEIALRMAAIRDLGPCACGVRLAREARGIGRIAAETGLTTIVVAATSVADCAPRADAQALAATLARLNRVVTDALPALRMLRSGGP